MKKTLKISIPEQCHENWNLMTPNSKGRFCDSCQKTVIDFTTKTDTQVLSIIDSNKNLCGRFNETQLQRNLIANTKKTIPFKFKFISAVFAIGTLYTPSAFSQGSIKKERINLVENKNKPLKIYSSILNEKLFYGTILDNDNIPIPGVDIKIIGSTTRTQSDFDGKFCIKVKLGDRLQLSFLMYNSQTYTITNTSTNTFTLYPQQELTGEVMVVAGGITTITTVERLNPIPWLKSLKYLKLYRREAIQTGDYTRTAFGSFLFKITNIFR